MRNGAGRGEVRWGDFHLVLGVMMYKLRCKHSQKWTFRICSIRLFKYTLQQSQWTLFNRFILLCGLFLTINLKPTDLTQPSLLTPNQPQQYPHRKLVYKTRFLESSVEISHRLFKVVAFKIGSMLYPIALCDCFGEPILTQIPAQLCHSQWMSDSVPKTVPQFTSTKHLPSLPPKLKMSNKAPCHAANAFRVTWSKGRSEAVSRPFASDTSPKWMDREGLSKRRTGTRQ